MGKHDSISFPDISAGQKTSKISEQKGTTIVVLLLFELIVQPCRGLSVLCLLL